MSIAESLGALILRELAALKREIDAYPDDASVWMRPEGVPNAAGTLALHLAGNLQHFVGAQLGKTGYVRDRAREFSATGLSRAELIEALSEAEQVVREVMPALNDADLLAPFPEHVGQQVQTADFLLHLATHLAYHLGQVDYHRRVVTRDPRSIGALPIGELRTATRVTN